MNEQSNVNFVSVPQAKLFEKILKENIENYKNIKEFIVKPFTSDEENVDTVMLRIIIEVNLKDKSTKSISFMLKVKHDNEILYDTTTIHESFDIEKSMYDEIVPAFENLYAEAGVEVKFGAKSFNLPTKKPYILLENLSVRGFKNVNRLEGLDVEHTKCVLKKLAQWHAASAVLVTIKGPFDNKYAHGYFREETKDQMKAKMDGMAQIFLCFAKTYSNYNEYADDIHSASTAMMDEFFKLAKPDPNEFNVLNHGDCWSNNVMFQYDAFGKIKETYLVDYQVPKYGSPAQDLFFFLLSSTKYEIKLKEFDYFVKFYHDHLMANLKLLNYSKKIPTLSELHTMLYKYGIWGFSTVIGIMAAILLDSKEVSNLGNIIDESLSSLSFKTMMYSNERYRKHAEAVLPWLKYRGALN